MISRELVVADPIAQVVTPPVIHFVALRSPRRGRVARHSPSIAIVGRRLQGRFLLGASRSPATRVLALAFTRTEPPRLVSGDLRFPLISKLRRRRPAEQSASRESAGITGMEKEM
jgi:hypothetical protein